MVALLASLRVRLVLVLLITATLIGAYFLIQHAESSAESAALSRDAAAVAATVAGQVRHGDTEDVFRADQLLFGAGQLVITKDGHTVFMGARLHGPRVSVTRNVPGGSVIVRKEIGPAPAVPLEFGLIAASILALVVAIVVVAAGVFTNAVREPIRRAIEAADRVAAGDLSARMGSGGPEEFVHLARAFDDMAAKLEEAERRQRELFGDLAHEIATPLGVVVGFAGALTDGTADTPLERAEASEMITTQSERLRGLLDSLRHHMGQLHGMEQLDWESVDLGAFCEEMATRFRPQARDAGLQITVQARHVIADADPSHLEIIADNLLTNAIRYTPRGGTITISVTHRGDDAVLSVTDTGIGIPLEHQGRVFDRMYRTDAARARTTGGSGLGLSIALRAARALGGRIELESAVGKGSTFRLMVPLRQSGESSGE